MRKFMMKSIILTAAIGGIYIVAYTSEGKTHEVQEQTQKHKDLNLFIITSNAEQIDVRWTVASPEVNLFRDHIVNGGGRIIAEEAIQPSDAAFNPVVLMTVAVESLQLLDILIDIVKKYECTGFLIVKEKRTVRITEKPSLCGKVLVVDGKTERVLDIKGNQEDRKEFDRLVRLGRKES